MTGVWKKCGELVAPCVGRWGQRGSLSCGAAQVDGSQRRLVTDLLACVPHPVACSPHHVTGRTGGGTEPRRPLTGMARIPGDSTLTLAPALLTCTSWWQGVLCHHGATGARMPRGVVRSGIIGVHELPLTTFPSGLGTCVSLSRGQPDSLPRRMWWDTVCSSASPPPPRTPCRFYL